MALTPRIWPFSLEKSMGGLRDSQRGMDALAMVETIGVPDEGESKVSATAGLPELPAGCRDFAGNGHHGRTGNPFLRSRQSHSRPPPPIQPRI